MAYLYILKNKNDKYYIGITKLLLNERLKRHNKGDVFSTRHKRPWRLIYVKKFSSLTEAREQEIKMKGWKGGNAWKKFLAEAAGSSNGRTSPFGGEYLGSNPSPPASAGKKFGGGK